MNKENDLVTGERIEVQLAGIPDEWYSGTVLDRPRKMWVQLDSYFGRATFTADEGCITDWRRI